jgi:tripartite-type tricarboxylate transporter receptor subunit TctC
MQAAYPSWPNSGGALRHRRKPRRRRSAALSSATRKALQTRELTKHYAVEGGKPMPMTPEQFATYVFAEVERWQKVVRDTGLTLQ